MRSKLIITGAIGVLAAATLTVNAETNAHKASTGSVATLLAATTQIVKADRDDVAIATRVASSAAAVAQSLKPADEASEKNESKPATPRLAIPAGCQPAIAALKLLHQADVAEDANERSGSAAQTAAAIAADRSEDTMEAQKWAAALATARTACMPASTTACRSAISGLLPVLQTLRGDEAAEQQTGAERDAASDLIAVRTAFSAIATACE